LLGCCIFSNSSENVFEIMQQVRLLQMTSDASSTLSMLFRCCVTCCILVAQVSTIEGIVRSSVRSFEGDATEAVYQGLRKQHSRVKVLDIRELTAADGSKREVDGVVVADGCAAIVEAKQQLDDSAVPQLASCLEFIRCDCHTSVLDSGLKVPCSQLSTVLQGVRCRVAVVVLAAWSQGCCARSWT
jgi:hypothetical protein